MKVRVPIVRKGEVEVPLPAYQSEGAAGMDLCAAVRDPVEIPPGERRLIPTGVGVAIPRGFEGQVRPRSGLALRHGVTVLNAPGTVDSDYRGELMVALINLGSDPFVVARGERIAQLVICPVAEATLEVVSSLDETARGEGGYGSTGRGGSDEDDQRGGRGGDHRGGRGDERGDERGGGRGDGYGYGDD